jgi:hypothetical protein
MGRSKAEGIRLESARGSVVACVFMAILRGLEINIVILIFIVN